MFHDYIGLQVFASGGEPVGVIRRAYADGNGLLRYIEVELESADAQFRLVPLDGALLQRRGIQLPYSLQKVDLSLNIAPTGGVLDGRVLETVRVHYSQSLRDEDGVVEIPIFQEVLVKKIALKEVLRIRKHWVAEQQQVEADLRHEDVEVVKQGDVVVHGNLDK